VATREEQRVEMLLRIRRRAERAARRAFQEALARAQAAGARVVELAKLLGAHSDAAREGLLGGGAPHPGEAYRSSAAELRVEIGRRRAELGRMDHELARNRAELAHAVKRRQAAEMLGEKLVGRLAARRQRRTMRQLDDAHAAHGATGGQP